MKLHKALKKINDKKADYALNHSLSNTYKVSLNTINNIIFSVKYYDGNDFVKDREAWIATNRGWKLYNKEGVRIDEA